MRTWMMLLVLAGGFAGGAQADPHEILVTPAWLETHLDDPSLVVLQVTGLEQDYEREHIPGARFLWPTWLAVSTPRGSVELPPAKVLVKRLEALGVGDRDRIVLCHTAGDVATAARMYVTLDYLGMGDRIAILDGGLDAWKAEGRRLTSEPPKFRRGKLTPRIRPDAMVDLPYVSGRYRDPEVKLVDGRSPHAFSTTEPVQGAPRGGHIPGAINVPFSSLTDSLGRYLPPDSLRAIFGRAGVEGNRHLIVYCNVGRTASPVYVAARMLGYDVRLYDGSFEEWSRHPELPVVGTAVK